MPYTPPSRPSPGSSTGNSPTLTRNHSYDQSHGSSARPDLPRSRSAAYIHKHRRTPSLADNKVAHGSNHVSFSDNTSKAVSGPSLHTSIVTKLVAADKFTASPIESGSSEDDEDRGRRRQIQDLAETLRESMMIPKRQSSPKRSSNPQELPVAKVMQSLDTGNLKPRPLTPEALKIAHSRSSSEVQLASNQNQLDLSSHSSPGDSDDEGLEMKRGPLLRKKSGELVKPALRPTSSSARRRPLSAPGTPTYPKAVHFNEDMEQVRHFLQVDKPIAVSAGSSPVEAYDSESDYPFGSDGERKVRSIEWEIKTENFPQNTEERKLLPVRVEQLYLSKDFKSLIGTVSVANLAFQKFVAARFTFDYWKTTSEIAAEFATVRPQQPLNDGFDRFQFNIKLSDQANLQNKTMYLCVRYNVNGQELWDSNGGNNFQIDFIRKLPAKPQIKVSGIVPVGGIPPRSRHTGPQKLPRPRSFPASSADDEFSTSFTSPFQLRQAGESARNKKDQGADQDTVRHPSGNRLANRYDFNTSLHAALSNAQNALGERSGLKLKKSEPVKPTVTIPPQPASSRSRPDLNSDEYKDLIQKFCYFGSNGNSATATEDSTPHPEEAASKSESIQQIDGPADSSSESNVSSVDSSASNSPPSPKAQLHQTHQSDSQDSKSSRSTSSIRGLSPRLLPYRSPSPAVNSAYQEFPHQGLSVQTTQC